MVLATYDLAAEQRLPAKKAEPERCCTEPRSMGGVWCLGSDGNIQEQFSQQRNGRFCSFFGGELRVCLS